MNYREEVTIDPDRAPITHALVMKLNVISADIEAATPDAQIRVAVDGIYGFLGDLVLAVHQLETNELPPVVSFPE